jgi:glycosyl transferase family 25
MNNYWLGFFIVITLTILIFSIVCLCKVNNHENILLQPLEKTNHIPIEDIPNYMICLERSGKCKKTFQGVKSLFPNSKKFSAIDSKDLDINDSRISYLARGKINMKLDVDHDDISSLGAVGCYLSHVELWKKCVELNKPIIVTEDDILLSEKNRKEIRRIYKNIPVNSNFTSLLYIPSLSSWHKCEKDNWCEIHTRGIRGTQMYYITPKGAKMLLKHALPITMQVDAYISYICGTNKDMNGYMWKRNPNINTIGESFIGHDLNIRKFLPESNTFYISIILIALILIALAYLGYSKDCNSYCKRKCRK